MSWAVDRFQVGAEGVVGLAGYVALEAAEDLASVESVGGAFGGVSRSMFWPAVTRSWLAPWVPTPNRCGVTP